jgi:Electron transfer flavoprotein domain
MASILAYIEVREGAITDQSHFVVAEARRIADKAGATVYGLLTVGPHTHVEIDALAETVSCAGADRVLCSADQVLAGPALDATHGALLTQIAELLRPMLILFPAGGAGVQLGPSLAVRIGAAYVPAASIELSMDVRDPDRPTHRVVLRRWRASLHGLRKIDVGDLERPVVAVLAAGDCKGVMFESCAEVEIMPCPEARYPNLRTVGTAPDIWAHVPMASTLVWSPEPLEPANKAALRAQLPAGASLVVGDEADEASLLTATPSRLVVLSALNDATAGSLPLVAPAGVALQVIAPARDRATSTVDQLAAVLEKRDLSNGRASS